MDSKALLNWYRRNRRDLPWRGTKDIYAVLVSEAMLQQTRVAAVVPYYERFMQSFPNAESLAKADEGEVMQHWQGLGYYRRARNLQLAAKELAVRHPDSSEDLQKLPGVGPYTAAAVASIALGERVACVDGNVERVFARWYGLCDVGEKLRRRCEDMSKARMGRSNPGDWNQAVMELGALVCTPKNPNCSGCTVRKGCFARREGLQDCLPAKPPKKKWIETTHVAVIPHYGDKVGLRRIETGWWQGLWEFPRVESESVEKGLAKLGVEKADLVTVVRHTVTNYKISLHGFAAKKRMRDVRWVHMNSLGEYGMPSPQRKLANRYFSTVIEK